MNNHYIPQFHLKEWCGADRRFERYEYIRAKDKVISKRVFPEGNACINNLYSDPIEIYSGQKIDFPSSKVLKILLADGPGRLTDEDRSNFTKYIIFLWFRTPDSVAENNKIGRIVIEKLTQENQRNYASMKSPDDHSNLHYDINNLGLAASMKVARKSNAHDDIKNMQWRVLDFKHSSTKLIISDNPCSLHGLGTGDASIIMPISPFAAFIATKSSGELMLLAETVNLIIAARAKKYIYAFDNSYMALAKEYLK